MLELDSERWSNLRHAYGAASDIPQWLATIENGDGDLSDVWSSLCHQYSVYPATFAAVPHLLRFAEATTTEKRVETLSLIGTVHAWRQPGEIAESPIDIIQWYDIAIPKAADLAVRTFLNEHVDQTSAIYLLEALAALKGCAGPGKIISGLANEEFTVECPDCAVELYIWPDTKMGFFAASDDPVSNAAASRSDVVPSDVPNEWDGTNFDCSNAYVWLFHLAQRAGYSELANSLRNLYGEVTCPDCAKGFSLMKTLEDAA